ncbi:hypothetical protein ACOWPH_03500 [Anabaena sp. PCC 7938]|uniref:hypothetical protein n=1 Tax=Anabaena sp. PCC 7938 TaxID=1296340 RepID=UPI0002F91A5D|nr:hypothetical protein [Anabaena sp. CCAP 1446/1C]MCM2405800.1 hypothetical protein [Anabaena sp. CCAP 1446/1C]
MIYKITPPQPSPYQGEGARSRGWGVFYELGNCHIERLYCIDLALSEQVKLRTERRQYRYR